MAATSLEKYWRGKIELLSVWPAVSEEERREQKLDTWAPPRKMKENTSQERRYFCVPTHEVHT